MNILFRLLRLLAPFRWWIMLAVLLSFGTIGASVGLMAMSAYLISKAAIVTAVTDLSLAITAVRFFAIARAVLRYAERYITHRTTFRILAHLRVWFYEAIEPLAPARLMSHRSGDLLTRITADIETLENFYVRVIVPPLSAILVTALACWIMGLFDLRLAATLLVFLLLTGVVLPLITNWLSRQPGLAAVNARSELSALMVDQVQGAADILALDQARSFQKRTTILTQDLNRAQERLALVRGMGNGLAVLFTGLAGLAVLLLAIPLVTGEVLPGVYLALLPLTTVAAFEATQPLSQAWQVMEESKAAGRRLFDLIDGLPAVQDPPHPERPPEHTSIELRDVYFKYDPDQPPLFESLNLTINPGERVAIMGASGAGKSTLINLLVRFWDYQGGTIKLGNHDLRAYRAADVRQMIAVVSQQTYLFNSTIGDNLRLAKATATEEELVAACQQASIHSFIDSLPFRYQTLIGENGHQLSGGQRQRLSLARAILKDAPVLILDEATAHLDPVTENEVIEALDDFIKGRTTIVITHNYPVLATCDRVVTLAGGKIHEARKFVLLDENHLTITAYNITPQGEEARAVETVYERIQSR